jgi:hypothetical protein
MEDKEVKEEENKDFLYFVTVYTGETETVELFGPYKTKAKGLIAMNQIIKHQLEVKATTTHIFKLHKLPMTLE